MTEAQKPFYRKIPGFRSGTKWKMIVAGVFYLALIGGIMEAFSGSDQPAPDTALPDNSSDNNQQIEDQVQPEELTAEEQVLAAIVSAVGEETNFDKDSGYRDRVQEFYEDTGEGEGHYFLSLVANDNLSAGMIRRGILRDSADVFATVFTDADHVEEILLEWLFPLVDDRGNSELGRVALITMTRKNADTINWPNFLTDNVPTVADTYWEHPVLK